MTDAGLRILALGFVIALASESQAFQGSGEHAGIVAEIEAIGGRVVYEGTGSRKVIVGIDLSGTNATDATLEHLKDIDTLHSLDLHGTDVTRCGPETPQGLKEPQKAGGGIPCDRCGVGESQGIT